MKKNISVNRLSIALAPLVIGHSFAMDIYVPAIPGMSALFKATDSQMLLTLSSFMLTAGIMQLFIGPLSDCYGRKKTAAVMLAIFAIGSILCSMASNFINLTLYRIIQSAGSCGMMVIGFAIVRDCYQGRESAKVYATLNGIIAFSPMFAPTVGSFLDIHYGWPSTFRSLLLIVVLSYLSLSLLLPETLQSKTDKGLSKELLLIYTSIIKQPIFFLYTLITGFGLSYLYLFCALSPYLIIKALHIPESHYGYYFFFMGVSFFTGSILCRFIVGRVGIYNTCMLGFLISIIGGLWMSLWYCFFGLQLHGFIYPMLLIGLGGTFGMGAGAGGAMIPFTENIGAASALSGAFRFIFSALVGSLVINKEVASTLPLALPALIFSIIGFLLFYYFKPRLKGLG